jgi:hypothetical protein
MSEHCDFEQTLLAALAAGTVSQDLQQHVERCEACAEVCLVWTYLRESAADDLDGSPVPAPGLILWRAKLEEKRDLAERSVASIRIVQNAALFVAAAVSLLIMGTYSADILIGKSALFLVAMWGVPALSLWALGVLYYWARASD